jgi:hypothetical protein
MNSSPAGLHSETGYQKQRPGMNIIERKLQINLTYECSCKILNIVVATKTQGCIKIGNA